jgi:hypothetical protein
MILNKKVINYKVIDFIENHNFNADFVSIRYCILNI